MKITEIVMPSYANGGVGEYKVEVSLDRYSVRLWSEWQQDFFKSIIEKEVGSITVEELDKIEEITKLNWFDPVEEEYEATRSMDIYDYLYTIIVISVGLFMIWLLNNLSPEWMILIGIVGIISVGVFIGNKMSPKYAKSS